MNERVTVWLLKPKDRPTFMLQWIDPDTGDRKSRSARTTKRREAEQRRTDLEYEINNSMYQKPSSLTWAAFRAMYQDERIAGFKPGSQSHVKSTLSGFEGIVNPIKLADVTERRLSIYVKARREAGVSIHTIKGDLSYLHATLSWAKDQKLIDTIPTFPKLKAPKKRSKGRPITGEEFERMLLKCPSRDWEDYLTGLWLSGMRLSESIDLWWDREDKQHFDFSGNRPMIVIPAETEKGGRDRRIPLTPDFAEFLEGLPGDRTGRVFKFKMSRSPDVVGRTVSEIGKAAGVKVSEAAGKVKYASAHDFRRSFGTRWSKRLMPAQLMVLMRHENINTTMKHYVDVPANELAEELWTLTQQSAQRECLATQQSAQQLPETPLFLGE